MPDITHPLVATPFIAGDVADADRVAEGLHNPKFTPDSMSVINGRLDEDNLATPYTIDHTMVRPGAMATGSTSGHTANLDFFSDFFLGDYDTTLIEAPFSSLVDRGLTVVAHRFYVPYDCSMVSLHWHVGVVVDAGYWRKATVTAYKPDLVEDYENQDAVVSDTLPNQQALLLDNTMLGLFLDGNIVQQCTRQARHGRNSMLGAHHIGSGGVGIKYSSKPSANLLAEDRKYWNQQEAPDHRWWSGHYNAQESYILTKGWHTASIRVTNGKWEYASTTQSNGDPLKKVAPHVRFKTCNMTAIPIR
jgi:hypothetical protein